MRHLRAVIGSITFKEEYMNEKVNIWLQELQMLTNIAKSEPQAPLSCFIAGYKHKFTYFMRTVPNISSLMKKIDDLITTEFIPAITGGINCSVHERRLLELPPKLGGLGIPIFAEIFEYNNSKLRTQNLCNKIIKQYLISTLSVQTLISVIKSHFQYLNGNFSVQILIPEMKFQS